MNRNAGRSRISSSISRCTPICARPARTDALEDTVDYRAIKKRILHLVEESRFRLIEALAQSIADECLRDERVEQVEVVVEKPGALRFARTAGVEIVRSRGA